MLALAGSFPVGRAWTVASFATDVQLFSNTVAIEIEVT